MKTRTLKQLLLYNYRYLFAYVIIIGFIAYFLGWQLGQIGPGLSTPELNTAARHSTFREVLDLPIHPLHTVLQWLSLKFIGVTSIAIRLPSVIIAVLVAISLYNLLKRWFGKQTALLSTAILLSADWFLFIARLGTGSIEFSLWLVLALLCFTKLLEHKTKWLLLFSATLVGLLFSPLGIYAVITLVVCLFSGRVFRERALEAGLKVRVGSIAIGVVGIGAATYFSVMNIEFLKNILNVTNLPNIQEYVKNVFVNTSSVVAVLPNANPVISPTGILFVRFFELIFILFGVIMLWRTRVNRLNLTVLVLSVVLVLASGLSSGSRGGSIILIPAAIYMTAGIRHLVHRWKRTFPKNPYARVAAFLPLGALFVFVVVLHYVSYFQVWPSQAATHAAFSKDLPLLQKELTKESYLGKNCYIETADENLRQLLLASYPKCGLSFNSEIATQTSQILFVPATSNFKITLSAMDMRALTNETKENNVRWIVISNNIAQ